MKLIARPKQLGSRRADHVVTANFETANFEKVDQQGSGYRPLSAPRHHGGRARRRPPHFRFAGGTSRRSSIFATLRSGSKGRDYGLGDRDKSRARPFDASSLTTDAGTLDQQ